MSDVMSVRAGCEACAQAVTATVVDDTIPADVAAFFRTHAGHAMTQPRGGTSPATAHLPRRRSRFSRRGPGNP